VKRSGRDAPLWVAIHMCMETMLGISLYSYLYLKLAKTLSFLLSLLFSIQQNQRKRGWNRFCLEAEGNGEKRKGQKGCGEKGEEAQVMYTHVSKCKNYKIFKKEHR
jgi:hypothetical protein